MILPLTVIRRIDQVLAPTKPRVLETYHAYRDRLDNLDGLLRKASGYAFYNTYTWEDNPQLRMASMSPPLVRRLLISHP